MISARPEPEAACRITASRLLDSLPWVISLSGQGGRVLRTLPPGSRAIVWHSEPGCICLDTYDVLHQQVVSHHSQFGDGKEARLFRSPHRYIWLAELDLMAQLAGFELESRHADWSGSEFTAESRSHVSVYRLPVVPSHQ